MLIPHPSPSASPVELLVLGAGWTSTFLLPLLSAQGISHAATSTTGRDGTIKFVFDPGRPDDETPFLGLPSARTILITFPLKGAEQTDIILDLYARTHGSSSSPGSSGHDSGSSSQPQPQWIQLGSTGIWQMAEQTTWVTRASPHNRADARAQAEDRLLERAGSVLNLAGLWGGARQPRDWVGRVAASKSQLAAKASLHMVHGQDVARAIVALAGDAFTAGERWMLTDMFVYDWWSLAIGWGDGGSASQNQDAKGPHPSWVRELMIEKGVRALPRSMEMLGRCYDSREFWDKFGIAPVRARIF